MLSIDTSLLYLIGEPSDPNAATVWKKLSDQFMKKSWGNKLELRRKLHSLRLKEGHAVRKKSWGNKLELCQKLHSLRLKEGHAVQEHIREMTELFSMLCRKWIYVPLTEDDRVAYLLLASNPRRLKYVFNQRFFEAK